MAEQELLLPDRWLDEHVRPGSDTTCLTGNLEVYFPMTHPRAEAQFQKLYETIASTFGGATAWDGEGAWCREGAPVPCQVRDLEVEKVKVITAAHRCTRTEELERVVRAIKEAAEATEQTAMGIRGTSKFYIIPTREL